MKRIKEVRDPFMLGEGFSKGRNFVMEHWDEYDESFWQGIIAALRSQGIREANKKRAKKNLDAFIESL